MKIYLINNSLTQNNLIFPNEDSLQVKREKRILSIEGEKESELLSKSKILSNVNAIYSSSYVMSISTAKYLAKSLELNININSALGERVIGNLGDMKIRTITEMQENDFNYKLSGGESLNDVRVRMLKFIDYILKKYNDKEVALFTHNVAITCLLTEFCKTGFNLDNRLILNYKDEAIVDGAWDGISIIEMEFHNKKLVSIKRKK